MQTEYFGNGALDNIRSIIEKHSPSKVFVVTGGRSYSLCGAKSIIDKALKGINSFRYFGFEENPKFEDLHEGASIINEFNPDLIIAVGGGSVIDTAKIISVLPNKAEEATSFIKGDYSKLNKLAPIVAIPTTSGSGSEATHFAVAYIQSKKYSVAHSDILPDYSIVDPTLTYSMSPYQTAVSGLDALCQAIESFWAKGATTESKKYASQSIPLIINSLESVVAKPDPHTRKDMAKGSNLAGKAINISKTTAPHALSYALTTHFGVSHGHAVALILPEIFKLNCLKSIELKDENFRLLLMKIADLLRCENVEDCYFRLKSLTKKLGLKSKLSEIETTNHIDLKQLSNSVNIERLGNHPIKIENKDIQFIYSKII